MVYKSYMKALEQLYRSFIIKALHKDLKKLYKMFACLHVLKRTC